MSRLASIARAFWWRHPFQHLLILGILIFGLGTLFLAGQALPPRVVESISLVSLVMPCLLLLVIYTFGNDLDLTSTSSAFPRWWLVLPVRSSFLASYPVMALAIGTAATWITWCWVVEFASRGDMSVPRIIPAWFLVGIGSWVQTIAWRPAYYPLMRCIGLFFFIVFTALLGSVLFGAVPNMLGVQLAIVLPYSLFGLISAIWAVNASRTLPYSHYLTGIVHRLKSPTVQRVPQWTAKHVFPDNQKALGWRDWNQMAKWSGVTAILLVTVLYMAMWSNPKNPVIVAMYLMPVFWFSMFSSSSGKASYFKGKCDLPNYLGVLPVQTKGLVWARYRSLARAVSWVYAYMLVLTGIWFLWTAHRADLAIWIGQLDTSYGVGTGGRMVAAFLLGTLFMSYAVCGKFAWLSFSGRAWIEAVVVITVYSCGVVFGIWGSVRLSNLATMEEAKAVSLAFRGNAALVMAIALVLKLVLAVLVWAIAKKRELVNSRNIYVCVGSVVAIATAVSVALCLLIPTEMASPMEIVLAVAVVSPIASPVINVLALDYNRHR